MPAVSKHLKNIFETGELQEDSVISKMETTAADSKTYVTAFYNLDAIIAVGYRVNSRRQPSSVFVLPKHFGNLSSKVLCWMMNG